MQINFKNFLKNQNWQKSGVIGLGLNMQMQSPTTDLPIEQTWIDLQSIYPQPIQRNVLIASIINELINTLQQFSQHGLEPFLTAWQDHDALTNQSITLHTLHGVISGKYQGISVKGELLCEDQQGHIHSFFSADVSSKKFR